MVEVQVTQLDIPEGMIDLGVGQPDPELLPLALMRAAVPRALAQDDATRWLAYGVQQGNGSFRVALASFLSDAYGVAVAPDDLFITNGSSQALAMACSRFARPGDVVLVEDPTYHLALRIMDDAGLRTVGVPMDAEGVELAALERALVKHSPRLIYTIPSHHNPSSITMSADRRQAVVALARRHGALVVADEVYQLLGFEDASPPPVAAWADSEAVLSIGSFSKILAPGLRLGWILTAAPAMERLVRNGLLDSGGGLNPFTSAMLQPVLEQGLLTQHLQRLRAEYSKRAAALVEALRQHLPASVTFDVPDGGFFVWLGLPPGVDPDALLDAARAEGVAFKPGVAFSCSGAPHPRARLCFAYYDVDDLREGARRLARVL
ncbi:MAG: PLP-dependent aminotransferase family protein [Myxococcota bacterium]